MIYNFFLICNNILLNNIILFVMHLLLQYNKTTNSIILRY